MYRSSAAGVNINSGHVLHRGGPHNVRFGASTNVPLNNDRPPSTWQTYTEEARIQFKITGVGRLEVTYVDLRDDLVQATGCAPAWTWRPIPSLAAYVRPKTSFAELRDLATNYFRGQPPTALQIGTNHFCYASVFVLLPLNRGPQVSVAVHGPVVHPTIQQPRSASRTAVRGYRN